jgi:threonine/homoserine/homoserine lactone efflux protein
MELAHVVAFNLTLLAAIASPGPSLLFLTRTSMAHGRRAGIAAAAGLGVMAALWTLMALMGLQGVFTLFPWAYGLLKTLGAAYLLYIAWQTWHHARIPLDEVAAPAQRRLFLQGLLINLGNPKSVMFAAAVLLVIFPPDMTVAQKSLVFLNHLAVELTVQPLLAVLLSTAPVRRRYLNLKPLLDRLAAAVLGALGLRLLVGR